MLKHCATGVLLIVLSQSALAMGVHAAEQSGQERHHHVVLHLNAGDEPTQRGVVNNIRHLYQALGRDHLTVELVAHGAGLTAFIKKRTGLGHELAQLQVEYGVAFTACSNTMKAMQLTRSELIDEVGDTVPAIVRLMERQEQGWAYIKP
jgi:uncharacterized protein